MEVKKGRPDVRYLKDMKGLLYDKQWAKTATNYPLYYMYRGIKKKSGLRYDITVMPARLLGQEFIKTKGHEHNKNYGELYIVLKGQAIFLMQKRQGNKIVDVYAVKGKKGDAVIIPPKYEHITINPSKEKTLTVANWVSEKSQHSYGVIEKNKGACYYYTKQGWTKNENYSTIPKLKFKKPLKKVPANLDFLCGRGGTADT